MRAKGHARTATDYDRLWAEASPFIRFNPGARHRRRLILAMLEGLRFRSVLDIGCGTGDLLLSLRERFPDGKTFTGADLSPAVIETNRRRIPGARFEVLDLLKNPLPERFDLVICSEVVEHLENRARAFANLASMVAPGGHLLVTFPTGRVHATEKRFGHTTHPTVAELEEHARATGLELVVARNWGWPTYKALKWATNLNPDWALRHFASGEYTPAARLASSALYWLNFLNLPSSPRGCQLVALLRKPA